jgi:hypothetical protein
MQSPLVTVAACASNLKRRDIRARDKRRKSCPAALGNEHLKMRREQQLLEKEYHKNLSLSLGMLQAVGPNLLITKGLMACAGARKEAG